MTTRNVTKNLIGMEDLMQGAGEQAQTRGNLALDMHKVDVPFAVTEEKDMRNLDVAKYTRARVYSDTVTYADYIYDPEDTSGIESNTGPGTWILSSSVNGEVLAEEIKVDLRKEFVHDEPSLATALASTKIREGDTVNVAGNNRANWDVVLLSTVTVDNLTVFACTGGLVPELALMKSENTTLDGGFGFPVEQKTTYAEPVHRVITGEHYLWAFHKRIAEDPVAPIQILFSGDSTTSGTNANGFPPSEVCRRYAQAMGVGNPEMVNRGFGGDAVLDWESTHLANDLNGYPGMALYVWRWGVNDPFYGNTAEEVFAAMESGFTTFRAQLPTEDCAVILMMPNSVYSPADGRDHKWCEQLVVRYKEIAAKYECCFIDTYSLFRDAYNGEGLWLDETGESGSVGRVHPDEHFNSVICKVISEVAFGPLKGLTLDTNRLQNNHPDQGLIPSSTPPQNFGYGRAMWRADDSFPLEGTFVTDRWANGTVKQTLVGDALNTYYYQEICRFSDPNEAAPWSSWHGVDFNLESRLVNSWVKVSGNERDCHIRKEASGLVHLHMLIEGGSTTTNSTIATLPEFFFPKHNHFGMVVSADNQFGTVIVAQTGEVRVGLLPVNTNVSINIFWVGKDVAEIIL